MAIIKLGVTVVGIRGTIGGMTFTANKNGPYARAWSRGSNPNTPLQTLARARQSAIPELWRALTPAQKTAWNTFAALPAQELFNSLGESFFASGFTWFTKTNVRLLTIGRPTRTAVPTISRPAAPTITALELPYLDAQYAKIEYPSGEFAPSFDQIITLNQANSIGRTVPPHRHIAIKQTQSPPDSDSGFLIPYIERLGIGNESLKGFANVYRQTTQGIRSSPGAATFVSTDSLPYAATARDYDGLINFALRGADLTANADSKLLLLSVWFRVDGAAGTSRVFARPNTGRYLVHLTPGNTFSIILRDTAGTTILQAFTTTTFPVSATWHNVIWSVDLANAQVQLAVNGILETPTINVGPIDADVDWTNPDHAIGATTSGTQLFDGCLAELYLNNSATIDLAAPNALRLFISPAGLPMDLGNDGAFPTNAQPIVYLPDADASVNLGFGGNYVNNAALAACSDAP